MKVVTDYEGCPYITAGKHYELIRSDIFGQAIIDDNGLETCIMEPEHNRPDFHLGLVGYWRYAEDDQ